MARTPTRLRRRVGDTGGAPLAEPGQERRVGRWVGVGFTVGLSGSALALQIVVGPSREGPRTVAPGGAGARAEAGFPARALRRRRGRGATESCDSSDPFSKAGPAFGVNFFGRCRQGAVSLSLGRHETGCM